MLVRSQVKYIQSLSHKKFRDEEGVFVAEGPKLVSELLGANNVVPVRLYALKDWLDANTTVERRMNSASCTILQESELQRISFLTTANQVLGVFRKPEFPPLSLDGRLTLALDDIRDPGNMGTLIRIADWFGVTQVVCSLHSADIFNPKVVQASMGSICRVHVSYTGLAAVFRAHPRLPVLAATLDGESVLQTEPLKEGVLLVGNESKGISEELNPYIRRKITIPGTGRAESLNAAVAAGIILSHLLPVPAVTGK
jgi:TrmH family RNA methyltransferase